MVLSCQNISKSFGVTQVLKDVSFLVNSHDKVALVGINGAGKSTLIKIIVGEQPADSGQVVIARDTTIGYLAQQQELSGTNTIYDELMSVKADVLRIEQDMRTTELEMKGRNGDELEALLKVYANLTHRFELENGYACRSEVSGVLKGLGFSDEDFTKSVDTLSGGQKTRVALGKLLLEKPDIIILDEPTNHLDMESIAWLETFLSNYSGAVILVSHDRYFINKIVNKVVELDNTKSQCFDGNYTDYADKKEKLRDIELKHYLNQQREIKHQEEVITKLRSFNREKSIKRAESREKMLNKIERVEKPVDVRDDMHIHLEPNILSGNDVLTVSNLSKSFGSLELFHDASFEIKRGDKAAIIGNNGTGKTTLLKIINGILPADSGEIVLGAKVYVGYYDQEHHILNPDKTLFDELQDAYPRLDNTKIRNTLAAFLFTGDDVFKQIKDLSGGERGRVSLAKLMLSDANLLILDEPTNHLDIVSKEILENAVSGYEGTVLYVSHDRYFINKTATRILELTNNTFVNFNGNYDYYMEKRDLVTGMLSQKSSDSKAVTRDQGESSRLSWEEQKKEQALLRKKQNDLRKCEDQIHEHETRIDELDNLLLEEEVFTNPARLLEVNNEKALLESELEKLLELWEKLAE